MKTIEQFKNAAIEKKIIKWNIHDCSMCGYDCGYVFAPDYEHVGYDSGCDCVSYKNINPSSWEDIRDHYNNQTNLEYIKTMNEFWGF